MTIRELDKWFRSLDSRDLADLFPSLFEEIMESADPERNSINDFIKECKSDWKNMDKDEKEYLYNLFNE